MEDIQQQERQVDHLSKDELRGVDLASPHVEKSFGGFSFYYD